MTSKNKQISGVKDLDLTILFPEMPNLPLHGDGVPPSDGVLPSDGVVNSLMNGAVDLFQRAWGVVSAGSNDGNEHEDKLRNKEVNKLLDDFLPDLKDSIVGPFFTEFELKNLVKKPKESEPELLDGDFIEISLDDLDDERKKLRGKLGLENQRQKDWDDEEANKILLKQSFVPHRGQNFPIAPRPLSSKVPPSKTLDTP